MVFDVTDVPRVGRTPGEQFTGTLYGADGEQVGLANQPLHSGTIPSKGRVIISWEDIESAFNIAPWSGPAMLEVSGTDSFELMTKLTSPSGLISTPTVFDKTRYTTSVALTRQM